MFEIFCHGGIANTKNIISLLLKFDTHLAKPGEFTQRAFLNGKLDLSQAESIAAITSAKNYAYLQAAQNNLLGKFSEKINEIKNILVDLISNLEVVFDYPSEDISELNHKEISRQINLVQKKLSYLIEVANQQNKISSGIKTVICGKPNVGKSSIFNYLLGEDKALVTSIAGTTRDSLDGFLELNNIPFHLYDTAGIRRTKTKIESLGIKKTQEKISQADLILPVLDAGIGFDKNDIQIIKNITSEKIVVLLNKIDKQKFPLQSAEKFLKQQKFIYDKIFAVSAKTGQGFAELKKYLANKYSQEFIFENFLVNLRQMQLLEKAYKNLLNAEKSVGTDMPQDLICFDLKNVLFFLGEITGENISEEIIKNIFSKFCVGK